jgi:hypothetical protein
MRVLVLVLAAAVWSAACGGAVDHGAGGAGGGGGGAGGSAGDVAQGGSGGSFDWSSTDRCEDRPAGVPLPAGGWRCCYACDIKGDDGWSNRCCTLQTVDGKDTETYCKREIRSDDYCASF